MLQIAFRINRTHKLKISLLPDVHYRSLIANHLIITAYIFYWYAEHMHQARERKEDKNNHTQQDMELINPVHRSNAGGSGGGVEGHYILRPAHQLEHLCTIQMTHRDKN